MDHLQKFPQPTRPLSFSKLTSFKYSSATIQPSEKEEVFEELTQVLYGCLEYVDYEHKGYLLCKIFSELEKEGGIEDFIVEKLKHTHVKVISEFIERFPGNIEVRVSEDEVKYGNQEMVSRGFNDNLMEASTIKLEKFKVKTVNIKGGVIKKQPCGL